MAKLRRFVIWTGLTLIVILTALSIYGAFLGAERAQVFFNSVPLIVFWILFFLILGAGILAFRRLLRVPGLLLIHAGCLAVLVGGFWGSDLGRRLQNRHLGRDIIPPGRIAMLEGQQAGRVYLEANSNETRDLPFRLALDDFRMDFYPGRLDVLDTRDHRTWTCAVEPNAVFDLGPPHGRLQITGIFQNFKMDMQEDPNGGPRRMRAYDAPGPEENPALTITLTDPNGSVRQDYAFERHPGHADAATPLAFQYRRGMVRDYISRVRVIADGNEVARKDVEVNHPLYYGGYHFYQSSYGTDPQTGGLYTVLSVMPFTGVPWVFVGYSLICLGVIWHGWLGSIRRVLAQHRKEAARGH